MRRVKKPKLKYLIIFIILILVGIFLFIGYQVINKTKVNTTLDKPQELISQSQESELHSPDGTMTLIMRTNSQNNESQTYSFLVADIKGKDKKGNERLLFTKTIDPKEEMILPYNSWSPDKKYVFLKEKDKNGKLNFFIAKVSGGSFADGGQFLDVGAFFTQKKIAYKLNDATGWASPTFLNITTIGDDAKKGPSYWFDINSLAFWGHQ